MARSGWLVDYCFDAVAPPRTCELGHSGHEHHPRPLSPSTHACWITFHHKITDPWLLTLAFEPYPLPRLNNNLDVDDVHITPIRNRVCQFTIVRPGGLTVEPPTGVINVIKGEVSIRLRLTMYKWEGGG